MLHYKFLYYTLFKPPLLKKYFMLIVKNFAARTYYFLSYKNDIFTTVQDQLPLTSFGPHPWTPSPHPPKVQTLVLSNMILLQKELNWLGAVVNTTLQLKVSNGSTVDDYIYGIAADGYYGGVRSSSGIVWADCVHFTNRSMYSDPYLFSYTFFFA